VSDFIGREINLVSGGVQNKRPLVDANFLDKDKTFFMFG